MKSTQNFRLYLFLTIGLFIILGINSILKAEAVFMNDGTIIEGKVIQDTDKYISIKPLTDPVRIIYRKDIIRVLYSNDYKNKIYIYKMDNSLIEGYIVYEDKDNYTIRENLNSKNELVVSKEKVNSISKKKIETVESIKKENLKNFSKVYIDIALLFNSPNLLDNSDNGENTTNIGGTNYTLPYVKDNLFGIGGGLKFTLTNSYSSFILFGGSVSFAYLYSGYSQFSNTFNFTTNLQALFGLNWNIKNNVFIQPYVQAGVCVDYKMMLPGEGEDDRYVYTLSTLNTPPSNKASVYGFISFGLKLPIRVGKDLFLTPFIEISGPIGSRLTVDAGVGISF